MLKSYWAGIFTAGYVNVSASIALSVELALLERAFRDAGHIAWKEVDSAYISFFQLQSLSTRGAVHRHYVLPTDQAHSSCPGVFRELQLHPEK